MAVFQFLQADGIVEVLSIGRVNGNSEHFTEVAAMFDFILVDGNRNPICFFFNFFRELYRVFVCSKDRFHLHIVLTWFAQHADNLAKGVARAIGPIDEMDDDLHTIFGTIEVAAWDENVDWHPIHIGADEDITMRNSKYTDKFGMFAFQHLHNLAFRFAVVAFREHGHAHAVAMQGFIGVVSGNEDVLAFAVVTYHVCLACGFHLHYTFHIFRLGSKLRHTLRAHHITIGPFLAQQALIL